MEIDGCGVRSNMRDVSRLANFLLSLNLRLVHSKAYSTAAQQASFAPLS
jgi:hypothetical protein